MPWRMVRGTSPSREIDGPAPAPTSRAVEVKGGGDDQQGWEDRGRGTVGAYGTAHLRNERDSRPIICDEQIGESAAKKESKGDRQIGSWGGPSRRRPTPERGVMQTQVVSELIFRFIGIFASVHTLMTRSPANGKQTNGRVAGDGCVQGSAACFAAGNRRRTHARSHWRAKIRACVRGRGHPKSTWRRGWARRRATACLPREAPLSSSLFATFDMLKSHCPASPNP